MKNMLTIVSTGKVELITPDIASINYLKKIIYTGH